MPRAYEVRLRFRPMLPADLPAVAELESAMLHPWPPALLAEALERQRGWRLVGEVGERPCCYASGTIAADEAEIHRLVVAPDLRRRGIGRALLDACLHRLAGLGARYCFLEVRAGNVPALSLYRRAGFRPVGRRRNYYREPAEDALLLAIDLPPAPLGAPGWYAPAAPGDHNSPLKNGL